MGAKKSLKTHYVYSTSKRHGNDCFHFVSMWNTFAMFVGMPNQPTPPLPPKKRKSKEFFEINLF